MSNNTVLRISETFLFDTETPWLQCFLNRVPRELGRRHRKAVIICPGGGYATLTENETDMVALRFQAYGFQSFVLRYSVGQKPYPTALLEAAEAVATVRQNAERWDIDPHGIYLCGFSAGGHMAASLAVHWDKPIIQERYPARLSRPDGTILCYPIITAYQPWAHPRFSKELLIDEMDPLFPLLSIEDHVTQNTPPCFLWHNADDRGVSVMNSIRYMSALGEHGVSFEAHIFPKGGHALSLADTTTAPAENYIDETCAQWTDLAIRWFQRM